MLRGSPATGRLISAAVSLCVAATAPLCGRGGGALSDGCQQPGGRHGAHSHGDGGLGVQQCQ